MVSNPQNDPTPYSHSSYDQNNLSLGKEILDRCTDEDVAEHLQDMVNIPQVDGALYGIYYGNLAEGFLRLDPYGHSIMMHPKTLKSIMRACCAIGLYTQESIAKADEIWNAPIKPEKVKYHYCLSCKTNSVVDIKERVCDGCKGLDTEKDVNYY